MTWGPLRRSPSQGRRNQDREEVTGAPGSGGPARGRRPPDRSSVSSSSRGCRRRRCTPGSRPRLGGGGVRYRDGDRSRTPRHPSRPGRTRSRGDPHHLDGELRRRGGGGGGFFFFVSSRPPRQGDPRPGSGVRRTIRARSDLSRRPRRRRRRRPPPRPAPSARDPSDARSKPTRCLERRPGKPASRTARAADGTLAPRREQSNARGVSPSGDSGAEAPPNATENPRFRRRRQGNRREHHEGYEPTRRIQLGGSARARRYGHVGDECRERAPRRPRRIPPAPSPQAGERRGGRRRTRPFPFLGDSTGTRYPIRRIGEIHRRAFVAGVGQARGERRDRLPGYVPGSSHSPPRIKGGNRRR